MVTALMLREDMEFWWVPLIVGVLEILLAFWAAGNFGRESVLLVGGRRCSGPWGD